jgi:multiple sugar transport system permease protein
VVPAAIVVSAVIVFPWIFTLWMSLQEWKLGAAAASSAWPTSPAPADRRALPFLGPAHAVFHRAGGGGAGGAGRRGGAGLPPEFPWRGLARTIFIMPMMATPVAVALVWTMMFHPQLGVLNYLSRLGRHAAVLWVYDADTVIPTLVLVEVWHWTPLVMLIVLGGLAACRSIPTRPRRSTAPRPGRCSATSRCRCCMPFIMVAVVIRTIDALKAFDTIYVITQGGPGTASRDDQHLPLPAGLRLLQHGLRLARSWSCSSCSSSAWPLLLLWTRERFKDNVR